MTVPENPKNILVIRFSSLGDVLLTSPFIRALKKKYPNAEIDFLVKRQFSDAVKLNKYLNRVYIYGDEPDEFIKNKYDVVIDLQNNVRSKRVVRKFKAAKFKFRKPNLKKYLLVKFKINLFDEIHSIPQRYSTAFPGLKLDENGLDLFLPDEIKPSLRRGKNYIGFCPGSKHYTKQWPKEYFIHLGNMLAEEDYTILLFGGKDDENLCAEIESEIPKAVNLCNNNNLFQTSADMKLCKAVICNDSGLMHTACASDIPVAAIFGSTVKEFGFFPYNATSLVLENKSLSCRPCSHIGRNRCPLKHFKCMKDITPDFVYVKLHELMKSL